MAETRYIGIGPEATIGALGAVARYQDSVDSMKCTQGWIIPAPTCKRAYEKRNLGPFRVSGNIGEFGVDPCGIIGDLLYGALGSTTPTRRESTIAYYHTIVPADTLPSFTVRRGCEQTETIFEGLMVNNLKVRFQHGEELKATAGMVGCHSEPTDQALQTPSISALQNFVYHQGTIEIVGSGEQNTRVFGGEININNNLPASKGDLSSRYFSAKRYGHRTVTGFLSLYFDSETERDRFIAGTAFDLVVTFTSSLIVGAYKYSLQLTLYECQYLSDLAPNIKPMSESLVINAPFQAFYDVGAGNALKEISVILQNTVESYTA